VRSSQRIGIAIVLSLLAHASLLAFAPRRPMEAPPLAATAPPLTVRIVPAETEQPPEPEVAPPAAPPPPPPSPPRAAPKRPPVQVRPRAPLPRPPPEPSPQPPAPLAESTVKPPPMDMLAMIEQRREQRRAADEALKPPPVEPPEDAATRNLRTLTGREGVGGVFQILSMGTRTGQFAFNGWRPEARSQWRETFEVDAGLNGNLELAMVRRMIELIRTHYKGDFRWESHRLDRVVILSARPEDSEGLEDFLMREFFGPPVLNPRR
jgi:hypothetical protein